MESTKTADDMSFEAHHSSGGTCFFAFVCKLVNILYLFTDECLGVAALFECRNVRKSTQVLLTFR